MPFWAVSVALHAVGFALLAWLTPVRDLILPERERSLEPEIIRRGDELAELIQDIRDRTAERLAERVALLESGQERMASNLGIIAEHNAAFAGQQQAAARARFDAYAAGTRGHLVALVEALRAVAEGGPSEPLVAAASTHVPRLLSGLDELRRGLYLLPEAGEPALAAHAALMDAVLNGLQFVRWHEDAFDGVNRETRRRAEAQAAVERDSPRLPELERERVQAEQERDAAQAERQRWRDRSEELRRARDNAGRDAAREQERLAEQKARAAGDRANDLRREHDRLRASVEQARRNLEESALRLAEHEAKRTELAGTGRNILGAAVHAYDALVAGVPQP